MIHDIKLIPLKRIPNPAGDVCHILRTDSPYFKKFGEVYCSFVNPFSVKAWKRHKLMTQNFAVPIGKILFVLYDDRPDSPTRNTIDKYIIGEDNYQLLIIPPMVWYGFKGLSVNPSLIINCADIPHDPSESEKIDYNEWKIFDFNSIN